MTTIIAQQMAEATTIVDDTMAAIDLPPEAGQTPLDRDQMIEVVRLALELGPVSVLEVGLGWGASAAALQASGAVHHHVIAAWDDDRPRFEAGCRNARLHGARGVEIHEGESQFILPALASKGLKFDLALIDGGHRFDDVFLDAWYCGRMLRPGGFLLLDDTWMPSIQAVVEWLRTNMDGIWLPLETTVSNFAIFRRRAGQDGQVAPDERSWTHFVPFETSPAQ